MAGQPAFSPQPSGHGATKTLKPWPGIYNGIMIGELGGYLRNDSTTILTTFSRLCRARLLMSGSLNSAIKLWPPFAKPCMPSRIRTSAVLSIVSSASGKVGPQQQDSATGSFNACQALTLSKTQSSGMFCFCRDFTILFSPAFLQRPCTILRRFSKAAFVSASSIFRSYAAPKTRFACLHRSSTLLSRQRVSYSVAAA